MASITSYTAAYLNTVFNAFVQKTGGILTGNLTALDGARFRGGSSTSTENPALEVLSNNAVVGRISNKYGNISMVSEASNGVSLKASNGAGIDIDNVGVVTIDNEPLIGSETLTQFVDSNLNDRSGGTITCTSTTRPVSVNSGQFIFETDTKLTYVWDGTTWKYVQVGVNPYLSVYTNAGISIPNNSGTGMALDVVEYNVGITYNAGTGVVTLPKTGLWEASTITHMYHTATAGRVATGVSWGSSQVYGGSIAIMNAIVGGVTSYSIRQADAGSTVQMLCYQTSGATRTTNGGAIDRTGMIVRYLGPSS